MRTPVYIIDDNTIIRVSDIVSGPRDGIQSYYRVRDDKGYFYKANFIYYTDSFGMAAIVDNNILAEYGYGEHKWKVLRPFLALIWR